MQATTSTFAATPARRTSLIAAAVLGAIALAAAATLLDPGQGSGTAAPAAVLPTSAVMVPVGIEGDSAVSGDPSVPSAASVFKYRIAPPEEPAVTF